MTTAILYGAVREVVRVLAPGGFVVSHGSAGVLEEHLAQHGRLLLQTPQMTVLQRSTSTASTPNPPP